MVKCFEVLLWHALHMCLPFFVETRYMRLPGDMLNLDKRICMRKTRVMRR